MTRCLPIVIAAIAVASAGHAGPAPGGKHHVLKATPEDVAWGWLDPREKPRLTVESGDTVSIETLMHARDQIHKDVDMDQIVALRKANPGGGPHSLTGPIAPASINSTTRR